MEWHHWIVFFATVMSISLIPGPSTMLAFAHGASYGLARASFTVIGNCSASLLQAIAAAAGLGVFITRSGELFLAIKYLGAAYLVYTGWRLYRSASERMELGAQSSHETASNMRLFQNGFVVAMSNPKAIIFFTALFPQFLSPEGSDLRQLVWMVTLSGIASISVALIYASLGAGLRGLELSRIFMRRLFQTVGGLFMVSGVGLAATADRS